MGASQNEVDRFNCHDDYFRGRDRNSRSGTIEGTNKRDDRYRINLDIRYWFGRILRTHEAQTSSSNKNDINRKRRKSVKTHVASELREHETVWRKRLTWVTLSSRGSSGNQSAQSSLEVRICRFRTANLKDVVCGMILRGRFVGE